MTENKKMGRPRKSEKGTLSKQVLLRLTPADYENIERSRKANNYSGGTVDYMRQLLLDNIPAIEYTDTSAQ